MRRSSWLRAKTDEALAKGNEAFASFLNQPDLENKVVENGSPAGDGPEHYPHLTNVPELVDAVATSR